MRLSVPIAWFVTPLALFEVGCTGSLPGKRVDFEQVWLGPAFASQRIGGAKALRAGQFRLAVDQFGAGATAAKARGDWISHARFLANQSGAYMMLGENRPAIASLLAARAAAERTADLLTLQSVEANLSSLYVLTGDYDAASSAAARGALLRPPAQDPEQRIRTLLIFGRSLAKARSVAAAEPVWREALLDAQEIGSLSLEADILELWGYELSEQVSPDLSHAEDLLARAWTKRRTAFDPRLSLTEGKLARLFRKKGDYAKARFWMDRVLAVLSRGAKIPVPEWELRAENALIAAQQGRVGQALVAYRHAFALMDKWRRRLPPVERLRLGAERRLLQESIDGYLLAAAQSYRLRSDPALAAEMFTVIQHTRAWSLESASPAQGDAPLQAEARRLESRWLAGDLAARENLRAVRANLLEHAASRSPAPAASAGLLEEPASGEAVLTYWLHDQESWLWVWTRQGLRLTPLPPRPLLLAAAERFRLAISRGDPDSPSIGRRLRAMLLGSLEQHCLQASRWDIVADDGLFQLPFAALPGSPGHFLAEQVELRLVPNALRYPSPPRPRNRAFAVADPVFNNADERRQPSWTLPTRLLTGHDSFGLPRLPGTRREAEVALAAWRNAGFDASLLSGTDSAEEAVLSRLSNWQPAIIHFATHTVSPPDDPYRPRLALSLRPDGTPGLLSAEEISALRLQAALVVMSACHSAGRDSAKGAGLLGLTRAWLSAGAQQVVATLWPVGDESTAFFSTFHDHLARGARGTPLPVASALRQAQLACIRLGGHSAEPKFWASHVLLARR